MQRVAIVTGGSRGIGKAIAIEFARNGYYVVINYKTNSVMAEKTLSELLANGGTGELAQFDVANDEQSKCVLEEILARLPNVDVLINNAGISADSLFGLMNSNQWNSVIDTTLKGFYNVTRPVIKKMTKNKKGAVVSIASVSANASNRGQTNYCAAKAGLIAASRSLATEVARLGIRVNTISPGAIDTEMLKCMPIEKLIEMIPLGRLGSPEEIAKVAMFLCSQDASYITGQNIIVNGGMA